MLAPSVFRGFFIWVYCDLLRVSGVYGGLLLRILLRFFEVLIRHLQIMLLSHLRAVPHPAADNVRRVGFLRFRLATGSQVLEQLRPGLLPCKLDYFNGNAEDASCQRVVG